MTIKTEQKPDGAAIIVNDTGSGIREDELPLVFERFYRGEKSRNRTSGGGGIGLAIVKAIVEAHRGEIKIESKEGKGTQVSLVFKNDEKLRVDGFLKN